MTENTVKQVMIHKRAVGITGLDEAIQAAARTHAASSDAQITAFLLEALSAHNYIPDSANEDYGKALFREYRLFMNLPVEDEPVSDLKIVVLGQGCTRCDQLMMELRDLLSEMNIAADLSHITDPKAIARYGVMGVPAVVINDKVVSVGSVAPKSLLREKITDALSR